jgi:putative FmdB family regulatory protein
MPFYEYQCKNCGHDLEAMQKVSDAPLKKCPQCGKSQLQRLMSAPVFRLKGGGWYETDFKGDQDTKRNLADRPEAADEKPKDAGKDGADPVAAKADSALKDGSKDAAPKEAAKEKGADKPADKTAGGVAKQPQGKRSPRAKPVVRSKSSAKRAAKKPAPKVRRRR